MDDTITARNETCTPKPIISPTIMLDLSTPVRLIALEDHDYWL